MIDLRAYNDKIFRIDEVLKDRFYQITAFDKRFFYEADEVNLNSLFKTFDTTQKEFFR
ncbi:hypothetical protein [Campylobacter ureolyticus]|uniref:Uncharacterized protein n=1 Tax=Campylobacter ureolyticus TaxID=827 RepID=A0A9Q4PUS7_9BACT|nr:hypothetical protein [Campylobacter ureolyticus]MCZ6104063.1 hypothetical protein [Campylobacter ureolyticus]MCZ6135486.1 hypothetical protein [Campylobacter ureolyticus]MCZ6162442.1 hypothetical protein [Campylobacter ureolyticus]MCZ6171367.1 hypothetical protein [Campylobacter ureolyticus]MDU4981529.1 hypothetical protein [Campylobacter ureolyticus]